jgi:hypothetical protein
MDGDTKSWHADACRLALRNLTDEEQRQYPPWVKATASCKIIRKNQAVEVRTMKELAGVLTILSLLAASLTQAQTCDGCEWSERGDRNEGVWKEASMISGGSFELMSVRYRASLGSEGSELKLFFWQPEAGELDELLVWKPLPSKTNDKVAYRMEPASKRFDAGLQQFSWPRDVIERLGLSPDHLHAKVKAGGSLVPSLLTTGDSLAAASGYAFVFDSGSGIDAECAIIPDGGSEPIVTFECYEEYGGEVTVEWDGNDEAGRPAADGLYRLTIDGEMLAEVLRPVETTVSFWHRASLD